MVQPGAVYIVDTERQRIQYSVLLLRSRIFDQKPQIDADSKFRDPHISDANVGAFPIWK